MSAQPAQGRSSRGSGIKKRQRRAADQRSGKATSAHGLEIASASGPTKLADGVFVVWQGVDTVELTWRPQGGKLARGRERDRLELELSDLLQATKARGATSSATRWLFETGSEEQEVFLTAKGLRGSRLCLRCESWTAVVYPPASPGPRVLFQLQNEFLGRRGVGDALSDVQTWTHQHLEPLIDDTDGGEWRISRVDLAVDVAGLCFERDDIDRFTTRATTRAHHEQPAIGRQRGRALTGFEFGRKSPHARIYNKTLQARRDDPIRETWQAAGYRPETHGEVWRIEFQLHNEFLRQFKDEAGWPSMDPHATVKRLGSIWRYLVTQWLQLRAPNAVTRRHRAPAEPWWQALAALTGLGEARPMTREKRPADPNHRLQQMTGMLVALGSEAGANDLSGAINALTQQIRDAVGEDAFAHRLADKSRRARKTRKPPRRSTRSKSRTHDHA